MPIAFAHRGASGYLPENTLPAFERALEQGATGIESDAWLAADGEVVLVHDRLLPVGAHRIDVTRHPSDELAAQGVPRLRDLYRILGTGFELSLDLEHAAVAVPVLDVATEAAAVSRLWACHEDPDVLADLRHRSREVRLVCTTGPHAVRGWLPALLDRLAAIPVDCLNMRWTTWTPDRVERVHAAGLLAFGWDAQTPDAVERLMACGIDALYADHPDLLVSRIADAALPSRA